VSVIVGPPRWDNIGVDLRKTDRAKHAMTDEPNRRPNDRAIARQNRLRDALRENLKRRKSQSRGRTGQATHEASASDLALSKPVERDETR
jgi:hypothetical protein